MSIALQGSADANATSITLPTHAANDTVLIFAFRDGSSSALTIPSDYVVIHQSAVGGAGYVVVAYKIAASASETSGTWTNASHLIALVFRGSANSLVFPEYLSTQSATSATITYAAQTAGTLRTNAEDLALVGFVAQRNSANDLTQAVGNMVSILFGGNGSTYQAAAHWDDARTTAWAATTMTVATSALYRTQMIGLSQVSFASTGGGGAMFFRPGMSGGMD